MRIKLFAIAFLFLLSACGGLKKPTAPSGTLDQTMAASFASSGSSSLFAYSNAFNNDVVSIAGGQASRATTDFSSCTTKTAFTDGTDADGIPLNGTATIACTNLAPSTSIKMDVSGTGTFTDKDDAKKSPLGGFKTTLSKFSVKLTTGVATVDSSFNGFVDLTDNGAGASYSFSSEMVAEFSATAAGQNQSGKYGYWFDMKLTPTDPTLPKGGGTISDATIWFISSLKGAEYTLKGTCTNLTYSTVARASLFHSGTCEFVAGGPDKLEVTYTAGVAAWKFKGVAISK